jgi:hypothetical protein
LEKTILINELNNLINEGEEVLKTKWDYSNSCVIDFNVYVELHQYTCWRLKILTLLKKAMPNETHYINLIESLKENEYGNAKQINETIKGIVEYIEKDYIDIDEKISISQVEKLDLIFRNFHKMVKKLRDRYDDRETIDVQDEYDVQDLLYSILQLFFDDVRKEEWTPSYAGNSSRMDFLLKNEKIVIEVKKTRNSMKDKDLSEQLIIDIEKYKIHPDCNQLICFVYDPEGRIVNPIGIVNDLEENNKDFVKVYINP